MNDEQRAVGQQITDSINNDPGEVRKLRAARQRVAAGEAKPYRRRKARGTKSD